MLVTSTKKIFMNSSWRRWLGCDPRTACPQRFAPLLVYLLIPAIAGCGRQPSSLHVPPPPFDPPRIGAQAMATYDADQDSQLSVQELAACDGIARHLKDYDRNGDNRVSAAEIAGRVNRWIAANTGLVQFSFSVTWNGSPLQGAHVELIPEIFFESLLLPGSGTTDASGSVTVSIAGDQLPETHRNFPVMKPGIYKVRITHPQLQIPPRYNTRTTLGCEVSSETGNPTSRIRFELQGLENKT